MPYLNNTVIKSTCNCPCEDEPHSQLAEACLDKGNILLHTKSIYLFSVTSGIIAVPMIYH